MVIVASAAIGYLQCRDSLTLQHLTAKEAELRSLQQDHAILVYGVAFLIYVAVTGLSLPGSGRAPRFPRSSPHTILCDRSYIGEVQHLGRWHPGKHEPLIERATWNRVQALLGGHVCRSHVLTYAGEVVVCGHRGHPITGEQKTKKTSTGERFYTYYRCAKYNRKGHPRIHVTAKA